MTLEVTPVEVASSFLEKWATVQKGGFPNGPVFERKMVQPILLGIRHNPMNMVSFFIQVGQVIKNTLEVAHGANSKESVEAIEEWGSIVYQFLIPILSGMMSANAEMLDRHYPELLYGTDSPNAVPVPEGEPSEVFKNIEGLNMDSWITPEQHPEGDDGEPPSTPPETGGTPES